MCLVFAMGCVVVPATAMAGGDTAGVSEPESARDAMLLVIQLGIILFVAKFGNLLFERIKLPGALGELAAGILLGPFALGRMGFYGFANGLFPGVSPELSGLAAIAAVVLLFNIGLETDLKLMLRFSLVGGLVGLGGMLVSFFFGAASVMLFSPWVFGRQLGLFAPQCLLLGTITTATSVSITARILSEKRKMDSPEGVTILSAAVIDDVLGIIVLAVVMSVISASKATGGIDWSHIGVIATKAVGVWLAATVIGLLASRKISFLLKWFGERTSIAIMALGLALILAGLFEEAGLAMIIGAYVMGLALSKSDISHVVRERLRPVYALLVPVFFCTTGMMIDLGALTSPSVVIFGFTYAIVALAAKVVGCGLPAFLTNFNLLGSARIGFGMAPRCEVALIIAGVGLAAGVLSPAILAAVIMMVLVNTVVAPPVMIYLLRSDRQGTRRDVPGEKDETTVPFEFPSLEMVEFFVGKLRGVFESEGFFTHHIRHDPPMYHLRKDGTAIDFHHEGTTLTFTCHRRDVPLVNTAVYEALAELERSVRGLKKPLDARNIQSRLQETGPLETTRFNMKDILSPRLIIPELKGNSKETVIDELLDVLVRNGLVKDRSAAREAVLQREESMSTGLQYGVAIPHGKTDAVTRLVCAVGLKREGIDFGSFDGEPSKIFILTLSPRSKPAPHIQFMSTISQILTSSGRERVLACRTARQIYHVFSAPLPAPLPAPPVQPPRRAATKLKLDDYIRPELVTPNLAGRTKEEIIIELLGLLEKAGLISDAEKAGQVVLQREAQLSTAMEDGIAIPHGRTNAVDSLVCAVGVKREGMDFGSADGKATTIFVLVLTPMEGADPYLQFVASVVGALDADGRERVLSARTPQDLADALTGGADQAS